MLGLDTSSLPVRTLPSGRYLFHAGDPAEHIFQVIEGRIRLERVTPDGRKIMIHTAQAGSFFAEASLFAPLFGKIAPDSISSDDLRRALRENRKVRLRYRDLAERETERIVWPVLIGYFQYARGLVGFCELRNDFRHFRTDRMISLEVLDAHPPRRRAVLMREWERSAEREALLCQREPPRLPRPGEPALRPAAE